MDGSPYKTSLGEFLQAWRLGWRTLPNEGVWLRLSHGDDEATTILCELIPSGQGIPDKRADKASHIVWWTDDKDDEKHKEDPAVKQRILDGFYVYHSLKPITQYTRFILRDDGKHDFPLVEGSVSYEYDPTWRIDMQCARPRVRIQSRSEPKSPMSLRFRILQRDGFRCRYCGRTAAEAQLQVDHVIPRSKGGATREDNLVTACWECNIGKRDVLLPGEPVPA